ncbi:uncharacterized protein N7511_007077, partial [Penicillium nucicola]|uniref:uncharacterized protein n=1 Tax=Penicillium nucicola TaxID=1850975 RepID=UPI002545AADA
ITECRIVQWFVKPGDKVSQFDAICEVQSDKASVEYLKITSRYDGVISSLYHEVDEMAEVGKPLLDIDVEVDPSEIDTTATQLPAETVSDDQGNVKDSISEVSVITDTQPPVPTTIDGSETRNSGLVVPAVRAMIKQHAIDLKYIIGSGKGGRVLKEDVQHYLASKSESSTPLSSNPVIRANAPTQDKVVPLTPIEMHMFKAMTRALSIPHFGYCHSVDFTSLISLRHKFNKHIDGSREMHRNEIPKLTLLPFLLKAVSHAFLEHPKLNAQLDTETNPQKPQLVIKASHNFGMAVDTPNGLLVPVVKDVQNLSIISIAAEIKRLSALAQEGRLSPSDMSGATFTVSNIGSIGGSVVSPIIIPPTIAIVALGKMEEVPVFSKDEGGINSLITKRERSVLSWSADHRVLDGAAVARCAQLVARILEDIETMGISLR